MPDRSIIAPVWRCAGIVVLSSGLFAGGARANGHGEPPATRSAPAAPAAAPAASAAASASPARPMSAHGPSPTHGPAPATAPAAAVLPAATHAPAPAVPPAAMHAAADAGEHGSAPPPAVDSLDSVRERLAKKLGATRTPETPANTLRVMTKDGALPGGEFVVGAGTRLATTRARPRASSDASAHGTTSAAPAAVHSPHWDYGGAGGPAEWSRLAPEFAACTSGSRQSPIDIRDGLKVELEAVRFDYRPSGFRVIDNGHTVQVNLAPGNSIEVGGRRYELLQFHFHRPSEERIDGRQFDMVVHLVHKSAEGRLAVVAVLLERGSAQPIVQTVWNNLPLEKGEEQAARAPLDPIELLPSERRYFTYMGSLTTPPCSEGVLWMVMKQPVPVSPEQEAIFAHLYPMNARPVQPASGRLIKESN